MDWRHQSRSPDHSPTLRLPDRSRRNDKPIALRDRDRQWRRGGCGWWYLVRFRSPSPRLRGRRASPRKRRRRPPVPPPQTRPPRQRRRRRRGNPSPRQEPRSRLAAPPRPHLGIPARRRSALAPGKRRERGRVGGRRTRGGETTATSDTVAARHATSACVGRDPGGLVRRAARG